MSTTHDSKFWLLTYPSTDCGWYQDFPLHAKSLHGMKKKYCAQYYNTPYADSTTLSKEEFFQDFPLHAKSLHGMKKKYCAQYDCSATLLLGAMLTV
ncbi:hypothetical protein T01_102 [Trichinella spiralis]|uniref:Uncharacterized protein n=1 Tax=Trichinella spiralis TaxID=6334 RepID=A0A0V1AJH7_TRISP|nr:hypothetical protein T01_102 [Trichinella spiralis]